MHRVFGELDGGMQEQSSSASSPCDRGTCTHRGCGQPDRLPAPAGEVVHDTPGYLPALAHACAIPDEKASACRVHNHGPLLIALDTLVDEPDPGSTKHSFNVDTEERGVLQAPGHTQISSSSESSSRCFLRHTPNSATQHNATHIGCMRTAEAKLHACEAEVCTRLQGARSPDGSSSWCFAQAYITPSSCSWLSLPPETTSPGSASNKG